VLVDLGLQPRLAARAVTPDAISLMSARSGGELVRPAARRSRHACRRRALLVVHRADLQGALQAHVDDNPDIELRLGCQFEDVARHAKGLTVVQRSDMTRSQELALALIGADGIWSAVRQHLFPEVQPQFSGLIAWRGTLEATQLPREYASRRVQLWMGPNAHLVAYPISGARQINVVAVVPGTWNRPGWSTPGDGNELKNVFASRKWPGPARMTIGAVDAWKKFALFTLPDGGGWTDGAIALLGDAAHAMLPLQPKAPAWRSRMPRCWPNASAKGRAKTARHCGRAEALCAAAPPAHQSRAARGKAERGDLPPQRPRGLRPRPRDPRAWRQPHAGAAGLDLRLAGVSKSGALGGLLRHCRA